MGRTQYDPLIKGIYNATLSYVEILYYVRFRIRWREGDERVTPCFPVKHSAFTRNKGLRHVLTHIGEVSVASTVHKFIANIKC